MDDWPIVLFDSDGIAGSVLRGMVLTAGAVAWTLLLVRIVGLRAFSKMTAFDFVSTVATASLIARAAGSTDWRDYAQALAGIGAVFLLQWLLAKARQKSAMGRRLIRNQPLLLMRDGKFLDDAMRESRVSRADLLEKIRGSSAASLDDVKAVVLETTGDVSVMTSATLDPRLLEDVRRFDGSSG